jgi:mRNA biogenesis factor
VPITELEEEIEQLEAKPELSTVEQAHLKQLKVDLEKIVKKKEDYVAEHPEQRRLVFKAKKKHQEEEPTQVPAGPTTRKLFNENGLPKHPERSIYYDPVMNPFGVPPPGMPYAERGMCNDLFSP